MPKRRTHDSNSRFDAEDNPIGLTGAFAPVKGAQSVDYDVDDDPVGLTQAFGAVSNQDEPHAWDEAGKWKDFDWDSVPDESGDGVVGEDGVRQSEEEDAPSDGLSGGEQVDGESASGSTDSGDVVGPDGAESSPSEVADRNVARQSEPKQRGRHAAVKPELSPRMKRSRRIRHVLMVLVVLLILVIAAVVFFGYRTVSGSQQEAAQQAQEQADAPRAGAGMTDAPAHDAPESTTKLADVPDLAGLLGKTQDEALSALGRGALVTKNDAVNEEGNPIKVNLTVALNDEPADSKTGTPTVYLGLGEDGKIRQAGYSASASALGFGALSFADAVGNEHVVEKTLGKVGVNVAEGSAALPKNKDEYSTYATDGTTVVRERCSFEGDADVNGTPCTWSSVLSYDYTTQVVTGNLNDTVRIIYVYITAK